MAAVGEWLVGLHPVMQALLAGCLTWAVTAVGAMLVFPFRGMSRALLDALLGFAAGVMIAASVWSLLLPAIALAEGFGSPAWAPAAIGVVLGALTLRLADVLLPHLHFGQPVSRAEGPRTAWRRTTLLVLAITLHNVPEGLAVGVAFGAAALGAGLPGGATLGAAIALAIGIAIQNFPEGLAVSMPLRREGVGPWRCFWYGQLSAAVEPVAAGLGAAAVLAVAPVLPYALAFAAGAMLFVVVEELIPESHLGGHADLATTGTIAGFTVMMILDVALG
jgi:ZIP family zinc transporter